MKESEDKLDTYFKKRKVCESEASKMKHVMKEKVSINHERKKLIRIVETFQERWKQLKDGSKLDDFFFKFHMDFLLKEEFLKLEGGVYLFTDTGIAIMTHCVK